MLVKTKISEHQLSAAVLNSREDGPEVHAIADGHMNDEPMWLQSAQSPTTPEQHACNPVLPIPEESQAPANISASGCDMLMKTEHRSCSCDTPAYSQMPSRPWQC